MHPGSVIPSRNRFPEILPYVVPMGSNSTRINIWVYFLDYIFHSIATSHNVVTTLSKISDFVYFLPFLFSLYHHPEPSGTFYDNPHTSVMTHTLDRTSMT